MVGCTPIVNTPNGDTPTDTLLCSTFASQQPRVMLYERKTVCTDHPEEENESHPARDHDSADWRSLVVGVGHCHAEQRQPQQKARQADQPDNALQDERLE